MIQTIFLAATLMIAGAAFTNTDSANALTKSQKEACYTKWVGGYYISETDPFYDPDAPFSNKLTEQQMEKFKKSDCFEGKSGGICKIAIPASDGKNYAGEQIQCKADDGKYYVGGTYEEGSNETTLGPTDGGDGGDCGGVDTAIIKCNADNSGSIEKNGVWALLLLGINILTAGIGIAAVGGVVYGSILYTTAGDNEAQVKQAKEIIRNVVIGILAYIAMFALLQFIIPGGIFS